MPNFSITGQYPVVTRTNTDTVVTLDFLKTTGVGPFTFDIGAAVNCTASQESGVDDELIVSPNANFYGEASVMVRLQKIADYSEWFRLQIGVIPYIVAGKGMPINGESLTIAEGRHREERGIRKSSVVSKNPESIRRGQPFNS